MQVEAEPEYPAGDSAGHSDPLSPAGENPLFKFTFETEKVEKINRIKEKLQKKLQELQELDTPPPRGESEGEVVVSVLLCI